MNDFQSLDNNDYSHEKRDNKPARHLGFKKIVLVLLTTIFFSFFTSIAILYKPLSSIEGVWVRQLDDNAYANGMVIEVNKEGESYVGKVIAIDDESAMEIGATKWKGFKKDSLNVFSMYDLPFSDGSTEPHYSTSYAFMSWDRKKIMIYIPQAYEGSRQIYIRQ